jgi:hypothetical protein
MTVETVNYERTHNDETIGLSIKVTDGRTAEDTLKVARGWVAAQFGEVPTERELAEAQRKIDAANYTKL